MDINTTAWHFTGDKLRDGRSVPAIGETLVYKGEILWCRRGLYASCNPFDALYHARGNTLHKVLCNRIEISGDDKLVCRERTIIANIDATELLRSFAQKCALDVTHLWDAPSVVKQYLETSDKKIKTAARVAALDVARNTALNAAWASYWAASEVATWVAARNAAWASSGVVGGNDTKNAARDTQKKRFTEMVNKAFTEKDKADD